MLQTVLISEDKLKKYERLKPCGVCLLIVST
jgi:hypothetical protein